MAKKAQTLDLEQDSKQTESKEQITDNEASKDLESKQDSKTQSHSEHSEESINKENKDVSPNAQHDKDSKQANAKDLESLLKTLSPQQAKVLRNFINSSVYDIFITYLENIMLEKGQIIHRINCYCFRAKEDLSVRIHGKIYKINKNEIIYIQKDSFGNSMLRNTKLERIM